MPVCPYDVVSFEFPEFGWTYACPSYLLVLEWVLPCTGFAFAPCPSPRCWTPGFGLHPTLDMRSRGAALPPTLVVPCPSSLASRASSFMAPRVTCSDESPRPYTTDTGLDWPDLVVLVTMPCMSPAFWRSAGGFIFSWFHLALFGKRSC